MNFKIQTGINVIGNVTYLFAQWILTVIVTRFLGYESVGVLTLAMSIGNVFTFIQFYGVRSFQSSDMTRQYSPGDYLGTRLITTCAGFFLCIIFVACSGYETSVCISIFLFTLFRTFEAVSDVFFGDLQREGRLELVGITMLIRGLLTILLFFIGVKVFRNMNAALLAIVIGSLCMTIFVDLILYKKNVPWTKGSKEGYKGILKACFPLLLASLLPMIITAFPRIILERYSGAETLGFYGNISTPAVIITAVVPNILASIMPLYGEKAKEKGYKDIRKLWLKTLLITTAILAVCVIAVLILGRPVLAWIYTDAIIPYVPYLYFFLLSTTIYAFTMCGGSVLVALRKNIYVSICAVTATVICLLISDPLIRTYEIPGAIAVLIISYLVQTVMQVIIILKFTKTTA